MNTRATLIIVCLALAGYIILAAITPAQRAFLLDNAVISIPTEPSLSSPPTVPPIGPYSEYVPLILDTVPTSTIQPTPTATLEGEPTETVAPPSTVPPDATPTPFITPTFPSP